MPVGWRECTLTRAMEIETLSNWVLPKAVPENSQVFASAISVHLLAARQAALATKLDPRKPLRIFRGAALRERAMSNLDAAEAALLNIAPAQYILGQMPSLLEHVQCHLVPTDPRRQEFERIVHRLSLGDVAGPTADLGDAERENRRRAVVEEERGKIAAITRAASSAAMREQIRVRSFRHIVVATTFVMLVLAVGVAILGFISPTMIPLCFAPEAAGRTIVVCPTEQSAEFSAEPTGTTEDIDDIVRQTVSRHDLLLVELIGLIAAAVAAAGTIRKIRGTSERYHLPVAMAALKLPTGAITAFLGLLLLRGQFIPGLSALDTSAQILAWALVFGYAQQLFTRLIDKQGQTVLDSVRSANAPRSTPPPPP